MGCLSSQRLSVYMSINSHSSITVLRAPWWISRDVVNVSVSAALCLQYTPTQSPNTVMTAGSMDR